MYTIRRYLGRTLSIFLKLLISAIFVFPFLWMVSIALQTQKETTTTPITLIPSSPQFQNIITAWNSGPFGNYLRNSLLIIACIVVIQMVIMVPAAYGFAKFEFRGKNFLFALVLIAFMTPTQITFLPIYNMMAGWGLLKTLLPQILPFMTNAFGIFLLRQYFMQVPNELIEAAKLDNANELQVVFRIMMPLSKPALATILLFSFVSHWNEYFWPLIMTNSTGVRPLTVGIAMLKSSEGVDLWNVIMAGNMILVIPILLVYLFASKYIIRAFAYSGIK